MLRDRRRFRFERISASVKYRFEHALLTLIFFFFRHQNSDKK